MCFSERQWHLFFLCLIRVISTLRPLCRFQDSHRPAAAIRKGVLRAFRTFLRRIRPLIAFLKSWNLHLNSTILRFISTNLNLISAILNLNSWNLRFISSNSRSISWNLNLFSTISRFNSWNSFFISPISFLKSWNLSGHEPSFFVHPAVASGTDSPVRLRPDPFQIGGGLPAQLTASRACLVLKFTKLKNKTIGNRGRKLSPKKKKRKFLFVAMKVFKLLLLKEIHQLLITSNFNFAG